MNSDTSSVVKLTKAFALAASLSVITSHAQANLMDFGDPMNYVHPGSPVCHTVGVCADDESPEERKERLARKAAYKAEQMKNRQELISVLTTESSSKTEIFNAAKQVDRISLDWDDLAYLKDCRNEAEISPSPEMGSSSELRAEFLIGCMQDKDSDAKWDTAKPYLAGGAGLAGLLTIGLLGVRRRNGARLS